MTAPFRIEINENNSGKYTATVVDETNTAIPLSAVNSIVLTLTDVSTNGIINSRSAQNVLNTNNCTFHATSGLFTWNIQPNDTPIVTENIDRPKYEVHEAVITVTYNTTSKLQHQILMTVRNLQGI